MLILNSIPPIIFSGEINYIEEGMILFPTDKKKFLSNFSDPQIKDIKERTISYLIEFQISQGDTDDLLKLIKSI
jgi:hypothetical protein